MQTDYEEHGSDEECLLLHYNQDIANQVSPLLRYICPTLIILELLISIASLKIAGITNAILYLQIIYTVIWSVIPSDEDKLTAR